MNLVAHEYALGCDGGVLLLSELTGAAEHLEGAVLVNPYDADGLAEAIERALRMPAAERADRLRHMRASARALDVHGWADGFLDALARLAPGAGETRAAA